MSATTTPPDMLPNLLAANLEDPFETYAYLRALETPHFDELSGTWVVADHRTVVEVLRDPDTYASLAHRAGVLIAARREGVDPGAPIRRALSHDVDPYHAFLRGVALKSFSPRSIRAMEEEVSRYAEELIAALRPGEPVDFAKAYSLPFPAQVIAHLLTIPPSDYPRFTAWSEGLLQPDRDKWAAAMSAFSDFFRDVIAARRADPGDDMVSHLAQAVTADGNLLPDAEITEVLALMVLAGSETTTHLLTNMLHRLANDPALWASLARDRSLVNSFVEETLRVESPVQWQPRRVTRDVVLKGVTIPEDSTVMCMLAAANRDEAVFADAESFDCRRDVSRHLGFGHGVHLCLGAPLARLEATLTVNLLLDRFSGVESAGVPHRSQVFIGTRGFDSLPLVFRT